MRHPAPPPPALSNPLLQELGFPQFRPRPPWWGADLQTLRDTLRSSRLQDHEAQACTFKVGDEASLLALLDAPLKGPPRALTLLTHGLGGSSEGEGPRRLAMALRQEGFAVLRLNLRGAGAGRPLAPGSYAADCHRDLLPVLRHARRLAAELAPDSRPLPLVGAGISLGGTILLNATAQALRQGDAGLDALVCISSPLDLPACSRQFERPRNRIYQRWLVDRLCRQVLADPFGVSPAERAILEGDARPRTIRSFDAVITAPRWGYASVEAYYVATSPLRWLVEEQLALPPTLLLHAADDPWVPAGPTCALAGGGPERAGGRGAEGARVEGPPLGDPPERLEICITASGGHNGFHGLGDSRAGCWSDRLTARWLHHRLKPR